MDQLYESMGMERVPASQSPEYEAFVQELTEAHARNMREIEETVARARLSNGVPAVVAPAVEGTPTVGTNGAPAPASAPVATPWTRSFDTTPTGRRAKGQLEYDVLKVCDEFTQNVYDWEHCTPRLVAERIGVINATEAPSTGAVNAVWDRWEKLGFAEQAKKPSRFVRFTEDAEHQDRRLDLMKLRAKGAKRRGQAEASRVIRPVQPRKKK